MPSSWLRRWRHLSLEHQLPLLMTGVLVVVLAASLLLTYGALARSAEIAIRERLERTVQEVASSAGGVAHDNARRLREVASDPRIRPLPGRSIVDTTALGSALAPVLRTRTDSILPVAIVDHAGRMLHARGAITAADRAALQSLLSSRRGGRDTTLFSPLYTERGAVHYWVVAARSADPEVYAGQVRRVGGPRDAPQTLRALLGEQLEIYLRNDDRALWAAAPGSLATAPVARDSGQRGLLHQRSSNGGVQFAAEAPVQGTPWVMVFETPRASAFASARKTLALIAGIGVLLTVLGALLSRLISRRVTRPLAALTHAAEEMALGRVVAPVRVEGNDEIGRLAASFAQMATEVTAARAELERRVDDAQAAAETLAVTNARLQQAILDAEQAREESDRASRAKSDFLAMMSHELRTPLNAIGGYAQLLELEVFGAVTESQRETLGRIARNQSHLLRLIDDVLNFAQMDAGQLEFQLGEVSVAEALASVEELIAPQVRAKRLALDCEACDTALTVRADRERLQQVLLNLLANAVKFTPAGGRVQLSAASDGEMVGIRVRDTGIGISPANLGTIFEPFVQGDRALNRPHDGVGLGLAISRDLARGMGGDLTAESAPGTGSVFTVRLPRGGHAALSTATVASATRAPLAH